MTVNPRPVYEFGPFALDPAERRLSRDGVPVALTPKVFDLLVLLVERHGRLLDKEVLLKSVWPDSFVEEANLTVHVSTLRRVLGQAVGGGEYIETVPRRGYRFTAAVRAREVSGAAGWGPAASGAPASTAAATAAVASPQPPAPLAAAPSSGRRPGWRWSVPTAIAVAVAVAAWIARSGEPLSDGGTRRVGAAGDIDTVAILPFMTLGDAEDAGPLGLGMADALITRLSNLRQISVRPTSSVLRYSRAGRDALAAGRELGVDGVLEGHVQRAGSAIRVSVQLLSVRDGVPLWADRFDADHSNLFGIEDSISERIAAALSLTLSGDERRQLTRRVTTDPAAYEDYQMGRFLVLRGSMDTATKAVAYFRAAIAKDPAFAAAHAGLATARVTTAGAGRPGDYTEAAEHAARALALDPNLTDARLATGWVAMYSNLDWTAAEREFRVAVEQTPPSALAHLALSTVLTALRRHDEAIEHMSAANQLEPTSVLIVRNLAWTYFQARRYDLAERWARRAIEMDANDGAAYRELARALAKRGDSAAASRALTEARRLGATVAVEQQLAAEAEGRQWSATATESASLTPFDRVRLHAGRGELDRAFEHLDIAIGERSGRIAWLASDPDLDRLRQDSRFEHVLRRLHLLP